MSALAGSRRGVFARRWIQILGFSLAGLATAAVIAPVIGSRWSSARNCAPVKSSGSSS